MFYIKENKGITITALVVMIIVIMILAGVSITQGTNLIKRTKVENYVTNMLTIRSKAKVFAEEVNAEVWDENDKSAKRTEVFSSKYDMNRASNENDLVSKVSSDINGEGGCECYEITKDTLVKMSLDDLAKDVNSGDYVVVYNSNDYKNMDIIYVPGVDFEGNTYYTLSSLQEKIGE